MSTYFICKTRGDGLFSLSLWKNGKKQHKNILKSNKGTKKSYLQSIFTQLNVF